MAMAMAAEQQFTCSPPSAVESTGAPAPPAISSRGTPAPVYYRSAVETAEDWASGQRWHG